MAKQVINIGTTEGDGTGTPNRDCWDMVNDNFTELYDGKAATGQKLDDFGTPDDNTDLNANTTNHGLAPKVVAPAAGNLSVLGVANAETIRAEKLLLDTTAPSTQAFGDAAAAGTSLKAARVDHKHAMPARPVSVMTIWTVLTGAYDSTTTFTFTGATVDVKLIQHSLFTCTDSAGTTRRIGYVKSASIMTTTVTVTVVTDSNLAAGDKDFKVAYNRKIQDYQHLISIPGEQIADTSNPQGLWYLNLQANSYLLPVDTAVRTAAAGAGAALTFNVYKNTTALFSSAPDMGTNATLVEQRPTTNTLSAGENISLRIMSSAGATNKAADFQARLYIIPTFIYTAF